jgi:hypothetical protein
MDGHDRCRRRDRAFVVLVMSAAIGLYACSSDAPSENPNVPATDAGSSGGQADSRPAVGGGGPPDAPSQTGGAGGGSAGTGGAPATGGAAAGGAPGSDAGSAARDTASPGPDALDAAAPSSSWPAIADYSARGPFPITRDSNVGPGAAYDIFRPAQLGAENRKHPVVSWANGTLFGISDYQKLLEHWASHGFVVIAGHTNSTAGGATHKAGIDWLIGENTRTGSGYLGRLDTKAIGAAGHSQGGGATMAAGSNKPGPTGIVATVPLMPLLSFEADKTIVMRQAAPMLNINATMDNRDPSGAIPNQIFNGANAELVQAAFIGVHEDAMNAAMFRPTLAWFRFHLMADERAKALFYPPMTCGLCQDPGWRQIRYKNPP